MMWTHWLKIPRGTVFTRMEINTNITLMTSCLTSKYHVWRTQNEWSRCPLSQMLLIALHIRSFLKWCSHSWSISNDHKVLKWGLVKFYLSILTNHWLIWFSCQQNCNFRLQHEIGIWLSWKIVHHYWWPHPALIGVTKRKKVKGIFQYFLGNMLIRFLAES